MSRLERVVRGRSLLACECARYIIRAENLNFYQLSPKYFRVGYYSSKYPTTRQNPSLWQLCTTARAQATLDHGVPLVLFLSSSRHCLNLRFHSSADSAVGRALSRSFPRCSLSLLFCKGSGDPEALLASVPH